MKKLKPTEKNKLARFTWLADKAPRTGFLNPTHTLHWLPSCCFGRHNWATELTELMVVQPSEYTKNHSPYFKWVNFISCLWYLNKTGILKKKRSTHTPTTPPPKVNTRVWGKYGQGVNFYFYFSRSFVLFQNFPLWCAAITSLTEALRSERLCWMIQIQTLSGWKRESWASKLFYISVSSWKSGG